jgi:signal transduction histidine kinase
VVPILAEVGERFAADAAARRIELRIAAAGPVVARGDRDRIVQIVGNYVSNALRYAPSGTTVTVSASGGAGETLIAVRDEGPGLTAEQVAHLFERFYRLDTSRSRALGGSGIGLAIVRALAEAMGGRAWAESHGPGSGSVFSVALPAA